MVGLDFKLEHVQSLLMTGDADGPASGRARRLGPAFLPLSGDDGSATNLPPAKHCAIIDDSLKVVVADSPSWQPSACSGLANR